MKYKDELIKSMNYLAKKPNTIFLGQSIKYSGNAIFNTLINFTVDTWDKINGLSFSPKKMDTTNNATNTNSYCVIIKIWFKNNYGNNGSIEKYMNEDINKMIKRYSVKVKSIRPEY
jgi:hypothetical protein